ncbi:hypothetical protein C1H76_0594 [Elsinoe australis]|uniref:Imitation switch two complex protein 1 n=1 Tax=Elsinoe australis TaxID=40998 RepID=A0A4U7BBF6_9PEZI|nr:hypothetical protein C1H76_0594 [Elsinoe australis]
MVCAHSEHCSAIADASLTRSQVLYKRKPIPQGDPPPNLHDNTEVWVMRGSDEVFTSYDKYLERLDFYLQRNFTDVVNGRTGMTFFEALESETASSGDIDRIFPEALRAPILRKVQFANFGRMDDLVTNVYEEFRNDYFPGEEMTLALDDGESMEGVVREKANFPELRNPDGTIQRPAFSRYFVKIKDSQEEALLDGQHMKRGRNTFTKANIKSFLKNSLQREAWSGAPWLVKEQLAQHYRLPMTIPAHLTQEGIKAANLQKLQATQRDSPVVKGKKPKPAGPKPFSMDQPIQQDSDAQIKDEPARPEHTRHAADDLDLPPSMGGQKRPQLKFIAPLDGSPAQDSGLCMHSIGPLLEIWNALNVHWDVFLLDAFTFDDFLDAMKFSSPNVTCELFDEAHCGVLQILVDRDGEVQVNLPELEEESEEEDESMADDSVPATPIEPVPRKGRLNGCSRLSQVQNISDHPTLNDKGQHSNRASEMLAERDWITRLAAREFADGGWQVIIVGLLHQLSLSPLYADRLEAILSHLAPLDQLPSQHTARSNYATLDVNSRITVLALITQLSMSTPEMKNHFEHRGEEMTVIRKQKTEMQRERKLHLARVNSLELDRRANNPDAFIDPDEEAAIKSEVDTPVLANGNGHIDDTLSTNGGMDDEDEDAARPAQRRQQAGRKRKREEELLKKENERLAQLEKQKDKADKVKRYKRILKDIDAAKKQVADCEAKIDGFDERLREMNNARMKSLGRDRFWGRYWWFERVGMPIDGTSGRRAKRGKASLSDEEDPGYANARLWVQGPLDMEREGFIEMREEDEKAYTARHGMTVAQRKTAEEGEISLRTAEQWGYLDDPDEVDALIGWLEDRGRREKDLKKELLMYREDIIEQMSRLKAVLHPDADAADENEDMPDAPRTRVSTRNKTYLDTDEVQRHWRCLRWRNTRAPGKAGRHCNHKADVSANGSGPKKGIAVAKRGQKGTSRAADPVEVEEEVQPRQRAASSRSGAGGKGIATRVASGRAKEAIAKEAREERDAERNAGGRSTRTTRNSRAREEDEEDEIQVEVAVRPKETREKRSTRGSLKSRQAAEEEEDELATEEPIGVKTRRSGRR